MNSLTTPRLQRPLQVCIVDDSAAEREFFKDILEKEGYAVIAFKNGKQAYEQLLSKPADLLLSDYHMPLMDGYELLCNVRSNEMLNSMIVIIITSDENQETRVKLLKAGANDFVNKTISREELAVRLKTHFQAKATSATQTLLELAGTCAHEINQPLAILLGAIELLDRRITHLGLGEQHPDIQKFMQAAVKSIHRLSDLVRRIADLRDYKTIEYLKNIKILELPPSNKENKAA